MNIEYFLNIYWFQEKKMTRHRVEFWSWVLGFGLWNCWLVRLLASRVLTNKGDGIGSAYMRQIQTQFEFGWHSNNVSIG